jgi:hypothetical protein
MDDDARITAASAVPDDGSTLFTVREVDSGEERTLWREQFEILVDRLEDHRLAVADLPPGVEPYATILTLLVDYGVENNEIVHFSDPEESGGSPYFISPAEARTRPERLHDDAILLADLLDTLDPVDPETLETPSSPCRAHAGQTGGAAAATVAVSSGRSTAST